mmetsp:Transcript_20955/g.57665  ORF Transcript_20955/g.57665 Transcript_20955/m.57665 type:complete len:123 (-) Transcript_20955:735-1103(-)
MHTQQEVCITFRGICEPRLISPVHRVLAPTGGRERYSLVFFAYPNYDVPLKALPGWDELASAASSSSRSSVEAGASGNAAAETKIEQCGERLEYNTLFDLHGQVTCARRASANLPLPLQGIM